MVVGMSLATYTLVHVIISLVGIGSGLVVLYGLLNGKGLAGASEAAPRSMEEAERKAH